MKKDLNNKVVYFHRKKTNGHIFYVGIGTPKRPYDKNNRSRLWKIIVKKYGFDVDVVSENLTKEEAVKHEIFWINYFGRIDDKTGILCNFTNGGEGVDGYIPNFTDDWKSKISQSKLNHIVSDETKLKISNTNKNKKITVPKWGALKGVEKIKKKEG